MKIDACIYFSFALATLDIIIFILLRRDLHFQWQRGQQQASKHTRQKNHEDTHPPKISPRRLKKSNETAERRKFLEGLSGRYFIFVSSIYIPPVATLLSLIKRAFSDASLDDWSKNCLFFFYCGRELYHDQFHRHIHSNLSKERNIPLRSG